MAVVLTVVQTKQMRINIHKGNNTKNTAKNNTRHCKYKYTYYQNTHTSHNPAYTHTHTHTHTQNTHTHTHTHYKTI